MMAFKLVSYWHANFSRLFCKFCRELSHNIRVSHKCRENFHVLRTRGKLVLNMFKYFMLIFPHNISQDCRATVVRQSRHVRASVPNMSPRNFGEFTM